MKNFKNDLYWYLSESIPNPLNSYQIAVVKEYVKDLMEESRSNPVNSKD